MSRYVANVDILTETWETLILRLNAVLNSLSTEILTANSTLGITGNSTYSRFGQLYGGLAANTIAVSTRLRGGNNATSNNLNITSNTDIGVITSVSINSTTDIVTAAGHIFSNGDPVVVSTFSGNTGAVGITAGTTYYIMNTASGTFQLTATYAGNASVAIDFSNNATVSIAPVVRLTSSANSLYTNGAFFVGPTVSVNVSGNNSVLLIANTTGIVTQAANQQFKSNSSVAAISIVGNSTATNTVIDGTTLNIIANTAANGNYFSINIAGAGVTTSIVNSTAVAVQSANQAYKSNSSVTAISVVSDGATTNTGLAGNNLNITSALVNVTSGSFNSAANSLYTNTALFQANVTVTANQFSMAPASNANTSLTVTSNAITATANNTALKSNSSITAVAITSNGTVTITTVGGNTLSATANVSLSGGFVNVSAIANFTANLTASGNTVTISGNTLTVSANATLSGNVSVTANQFSAAPASNANTSLTVTSNTITITSNNTALKSNSSVTAIGITNDGTNTNTNIGGNNLVVSANAAFNGSLILNTDYAIQVVSNTDIGNTTSTAPLAGTANSVNDFITASSHGLANGDTIIFTAITGTIGLNTNTIYYVANANSSAFQVAETTGVSPLIMDITANSASVTITKSLLARKVFDFPKASWSTAKIQAQAKNGTKTQATELLIAHDGTTAYVTIYGTVSSPSSNSATPPLGIYSAAINNANVEVYLLQTTANSAVKIAAHLIK